MPQDYFSAHQQVLEQAVAAARSRVYFSAFAESPSPRHYGETAAGEGLAAFEALKGHDFPLDVDGATGRVGSERSPYGFDLTIGYPQVPADRLIEQAGKALQTAFKVAQGADIRVEKRVPAGGGFGDPVGGAGQSGSHDGPGDLSGGG